MLGPGSATQPIPVTCRAEAAVASPPPPSQKRALGRPAPRTHTMCLNPRLTPGENFVLLSEQSCNPKPGVPVLGGGLLPTKTCFNHVKETQRNRAGDRRIPGSHTNGRRHRRKQPKWEDAGSGSAMTSACFLPSFETFTKDSFVSPCLPRPFFF